MSISHLEDLSNEILEQILSELSPKDLLKGFLNINTRLNRLIFSLNYSIYLIKRNIVEDDVRAALFLRDQVVSLVVTKRWCMLIHYFANLRTLRVLGFAYPFSTSHINSKTLLHIKHMEFCCDDFDWDNFMGAGDCHYARQMVRCCVGKLINTPTISCRTLRSIKIQTCTSERLASLLHLAPNLIDLGIGLYRDISIELAGYEFIGISITTEGNEHPSFTPTPSHHFEGIFHHQLRRIKLRFDFCTTLKWLDSFLLCTPDVVRFSLYLPRSYDVFSFVEFHRIITQRLPNLILKNFGFRYCCLPKQFDLEQHRNIGRLFKTMVTNQYEHRTVHLLIISVNWKNDDGNHDDDYDDDDDDDDNGDDNGKDYLADDDGDVALGDDNNDGDND
jgi:hypothetical protein